MMSNNFLWNIYACCLLYRKFINRPILSFTYINSIKLLSFPIIIQVNLPIQNYFGTDACINYITFSFKINSKNITFSFNKHEITIRFQETKDNYCRFNVKLFHKFINNQSSSMSIEKKLYYIICNFSQLSIPYKRSIRSFLFVWNLLSGYNFDFRRRSNKNYFEIGKFLSSNKWNNEYIPGIKRASFKRINLIFDDIPFLASSEILWRVKTFKLNNSIVTIEFVFFPGIFSASYTDFHIFGASNSWNCITK